jgi:exopolysaccharide production protein ExoZ
LSVNVRLYSIQYLRALAATAVIIFHTGVSAFGYIGNAGVDIFFVISGFVMWMVTISRPQPPGHFFLNRLLRIVPMYWIVTLLFVGAAILMPALFPRLILDVRHTVASLLFIPMHSPSNGRIWPVLVPGWTLNYEMFFYAAFTLTLFLAKKRRLPILFCFFSGLAIIGRLYTGENPLVVTYTDSIMLEFLAGLILGYAVELNRLPPRFCGYALLSIGLLSLLASAFFDITSPRVLVWGFPASMIVAGAVVTELKGGVPVLPLAILLGDASYSIYLTHTLTISALSKFKILFGPASFFATCLSVSLLVGIAAWRFIERPMADSVKMVKSINKRAISRVAQPVELDEHK